MLQQLLNKSENEVQMPAIGSYLNSMDEVIDEDVFINPDRFPHMLIGGLSGSGKSSWINSIIANLLHEPIVMWGIDCKYGVELTPWRKRFERLADSPDAATTLIRDVYWMVQDRLQRMKAGGVRLWPTAWGPRYIVFIDEIVEFLAPRADPKPGETTAKREARAKNEAKSRELDLISLASISRAARVTLVVATQNPTVDVVPTSVKSNMDYRVCCRVKSSQSYGVILGHGSNDSQVNNSLSPQDLRFDMPGVAFVDWGEGFHRKARAFYYDDDEIQAAMDRFEYHRWAEHWGIN
jgi:S-DNA-T family DNA segregation ATPase FtsK/SpoIIIE